MKEQVAAVLVLSHELGRPDRQLAILGEGNTSARLTAEQFAVKASGACLENLTEDDVSLCQNEPILGLLEKRSLPDAEVDQILLDARVAGYGKKPSTEAIFHAWLLTLEGVNFVGHCHPLAINQILCSPRARDFAERRLFPDEVVCCGPTSVFIPYADPGVPLAREIKDRTKRFIDERGSLPRLILLQNHGAIALGATPDSVIGCLRMAEKAAAIFMGAAAMGGPVFMTPQHVARIAERPDEAYRQKELKL